MQKRERQRRASGDKVVFRALSMALGVALFFVLYLSSNLSTAGSMSELFTAAFWANFGWMVLLCLIADYGGKVLAFALVQTIYKRPTANFNEVNDIKLGGFLTHMVEVLLRALIFMLGAAQVIQSQLFANQTVWTLILTYIVIKIAIAAIARLVVGAVV